MNEKSKYKHHDKERLFNFGFEAIKTHLLDENDDKTFSEVRRFSFTGITEAQVLEFVQKYNSKFYGWNTSIFIDTEDLDDDAPRGATSRQYVILNNELVATSVYSF